MGKRGLLARLFTSTSTDRLTGLANRRRFHDRWASALGGSAGPTALLSIGLDGLQPISDRYGREAADDVLVAVAERLNEAVRAGDVVARLGGDEFAVILPWTDDATAATVATRVRGALARHFDTPGGKADVGAVIGVITAMSGAHPGSELRRADTAMYLARIAGRGALDE